MATYTAPTTRSSGVLITASIWNTDLVENIKYLKDAPTFDGVVTFSVAPIFSSATASQAVFTNASKALVSNAITGTGNVVMSTSPTLVTPVLGTPASGTLTNCTGLPAASVVAGTFGSGNYSITGTLAIGATKQLYLDGGSDTYLYEPSGNAIAAVTGGSERLRIDSSGKVGIGTTSPAAPLEIKSTGARMLNINSSHAGGPYVAWQESGSDGFYIGAGGAVSGLGSGYDLYMGVAGQPLSLYSADTNGFIRFFTGGAAAGNERVRIISSGYVGIGTTSPSYQLQLSTDSAAKPSTNTWTISSDERIKQDILPYSDGLAMLLNIQPISYAYNGLGGFAASEDRHIGLSAQALQAVAPYMISSHLGKLHPEDAENTEILDYNGHAMTFALINAVKELHARLVALEAN